MLSLIFFLPWSLSFIIFYTYVSIAQSINEEFIDKMDLYYNISVSVSYLNYFTPFTVNFIFNRNFRNEIKNLFLNRKKNIIRMNSINTINTVTSGGVWNSQFCLVFYFILGYNYSLKVKFFIPELKPEN